MKSLTAASLAGAILGVGVFFSSASNTHAQLPPAHFGVAADAGGLTVGAAGSSPRNTSADRPVEEHDDLLDAHFSIEQRASAEAFGGPRPEATAAAEARVIFAENVFVGAQSSADAIITYIVHIGDRPDAGLVWRPSVIPIDVHARGYVIGRGSAVVEIRDTASSTAYFIGNAVGLQDPNPEPSFDRHALLNIPPDSYLRVNLQASAFAYDTNLPGSATQESSQALADPVFTFDQAAFDLYAASLGQPTFDLASAFQLEFSEGIQGVPEPGIPALLMSAAGIFGLRRRRSRG